MDTANVICKYFSKVGENNDCVTINDNISDFKGDEDNDIISPGLISPFDRRIENSEVKQVIKFLKLRKAAGVDQIETFMLKFANDETIDLIKNLFNTIIETGKITSIWKKGKIIPIPKNKENKIKVDKFRPISLLSVVGKVFEKVIMTRLNALVVETNMIPKTQSGFVKGKSTLNNQIILQQKIHDTFARKEIMVAVFLDIKKAYDCVDRKLLIKELKQMGLRGKVSNCIYDILGEDRCSKVIFDGVESKEMKFPYGVPQGFPLSPILLTFI